MKCVIFFCDVNCNIMHSKSQYYFCSQPNKQSSILDVLWSLWPQLPSHGRKAAQFVDLLGFFSIKTLQDEKKIREFVQEAVQVLKSQNTTLATHPNSNIYGSLSQLVEFNGYYLESDPCLVCNNPEVCT